MVSSVAQVHDSRGIDSHSYRILECGDCTGPIPKSSRSYPGQLCHRARLRYLPYAEVAHATHSPKVAASRHNNLYSWTRCWFHRSISMRSPSSSSPVWFCLRSSPCICMRFPGDRGVRYSARWPLPEDRSSSLRCWQAAEILLIYKTLSPVSPTPQLLKQLFFTKN